LFVECGLMNRNLSKKGVRDPDVKILGAGWDRATWFCTNPRCRNIVRLAK
jgi:hypothetical protein